MGCLFFCRFPRKARRFAAGEHAPLFSPKKPASRRLRASKGEGFSLFSREMLLFFSKCGILPSKRLQTESDPPHPRSAFGP